MSIGRHVEIVLPLAVGFLVLTGCPALVHAQADTKGPTKAERANAREAYDKGTAAFEKGDYVTALDSFVKANALIPSVQAMYWVALSQDRLGRTRASRARRAPARAVCAHRVVRAARAALTCP